MVLKAFVFANPFGDLVKAVYYLLPKIHKITYTQYFTFHFSQVHRLPEAYLDDRPLSRGRVGSLYRVCTFGIEVQVDPCRGRQSERASGGRCLSG